MAKTRNGLTATSDAELFKDVVHVVLNRGKLDIEARRDLLVRKALIEKFCDLAFTQCQAALRVFPGMLGGESAHAAQQRGCQARRAGHLVVDNALHSKYQIFE